MSRVDSDTERQLGNQVSKPLRLLVIGHSLVIALNRSTWRELATDPSFDVTVAAPQFFQGDLRPVNIEPEPQGSRLTLVPLDASWTGRIHIFRYRHRQLRQLMRQGEFDVVHAWEEPYVYAGYQIARSLRDSPSRFVFRTAQNLVKNYPPPFGYFEKQTVGRAQAWIAGGNLVFDAMVRRGYPKDKGKVLTLSVDTAAFRPLSDDERNHARKEMGLQAPVIGFLGRFSQEKGVDVLMQAIELLPRHQPWSLLLLGSGPYKSKIEDWATARGWSGRVHVKLVKHEDAPRFVPLMDVLVAPSQTTKHWREQFGRMIVEAFASGVAVIGSDSGEIPFVIGDAGCVVKEDDPAAWANAILELLQNAETRHTLSQRGLQRAGKYSSSTVAAQFAEFYSRLAEQPKTTLQTTT
jgi:glycosyltransferase involved in cell wall biosynthesis